MRHLKHHFQLSVKQEHRKSLMANLASQLFLHEKIKTTLIKAKALRPFAERIITLAKRAALAEKPEQKLHCRRLAIARIRNEAAVKKLFDETVSQFLKREGGYTRIYKLMSRVGDGAPMALIQLVEAPSEKRRSTKKAKGAKSKVTKAIPSEASAAEAVEAASVVEEQGEAKEASVADKDEVKDETSPVSPDKKEPEA
jgi:large subunit ribosomal protein L17